VSVEEPWPHNGRGRRPSPEAGFRHGDHGRSRHPREGPRLAGAQHPGGGHTAEGPRPAKQPILADAGEGAAELSAAGWAGFEDRGGLQRCHPRPPLKRGGGLCRHCQPGGSRQGHRSRRPCAGGRLPARRLLEQGASPGARKPVCAAAVQCAGCPGAGGDAVGGRRGADCRRGLGCGRPHPGWGELQPGVCGSGLHPAAAHPHPGGRQRRPGGRCNGS